MTSQVAIVILSKNNPKLLEQCILSILKNTLTTKYKIYIGDTGSDEITLHIIINMLKKYLTAESCRLILLDNYHFADNNNTIINTYVDEEWVLLCNDDIQLKDNCIDALLSWGNIQDNIGSIGCRLVFPDGSVQHAGQTVQIDEFNMLQCTHRGYKCRRKYKNEKVAGNTAALMMTRRDTFISNGGFDESYTECWEDIHLNMKYLLAGYSNWYLDDITAIHYESYTRTKSSEATYRLRYDYTYKLKPWFDQLSASDKQTVLSYN